MSPRRASTVLSTWTSCMYTYGHESESILYTYCNALCTCQEYIRDKSMQPCIPTVKYILQKWRSKTSRVGMVTILLFLRNAWIQLLALADNDVWPSPVTDCDTYGRRRRGGYGRYRFKEAYEAYGTGKCQLNQWRAATRISWRTARGNFYCSARYNVRGLRRVR